MKISERIRRFFRLSHPELSRAEMAAKLIDICLVNLDLIADLRRACINGHWRLDHPLSVFCPESMKTRFPKLTEEETEIQLKAIRGLNRLTLVNLAKGIVVESPADVRRLNQ